MNVRDKRKSKLYFEGYLSIEKDRLNKFLEKRETLENTEKVDLYISTISMNILIAEFSAGADKDSLYIAYKRIMKYCHKPSYEELLRILSFAILLEDNGNEIVEYISNNDNKIRDDKLLSTLANKINSNKYPATSKYEVEFLYSQLSAVIDSQKSVQKETALIEYMGTWYSKCEGASWHESLNNENNVYYGYWCFEAAALAKIYLINTTELEKNEYFPVI